MRWVRYRDAGDPETRPRLGAVVGDLIHASTQDVSLLGLLGDGHLATYGSRLLSSPDEVVAITDVSLAAPIESPPSIRDFMAFEQHVEGMGRLAGTTPSVPDVWYRQPLFYFSNPACLHGPDDDVAMPPGGEVFDFELEVAAIVGLAPGITRLSDLTVEESARCISGYVLMNDWTARDLQFAEMQGPLGPCKGKDFAISLGPWLLTADELPGLATGESADIALTASIDGVVFGGDSPASMAWTFAELVSYASRGTRLRVGDVFGSGTCGNGCLAERWGREGRDSMAPLRPDAVVTLDAGPLGRQTSRVRPAGPVRNPLRDRRSPAGSDEAGDGS